MLDATLQELRLTPERVQALCVAQVRKGSCGRRGLPDWLVAQMHADYQRGLSTHRLAKKYGRSAQSLWEVFRKRRLVMRPDPKAKSGARIVWRGCIWTPNTKGAWRPTTGDRARLLHREMWQAASGRKIPAGWQVSFRNGNFDDVRPANLFCAPAADVTRHHARRRWPSARLSEAQRLTRRRRLGLERYYRLKAQFQTRGLRCDGKPWRRRPKAEVDVALARVDLNAAWRKFREAA